MRKLATALLVLACWCFHPARAEEIITATGLFCDTQEELAEVVVASDYDVGAAIEKVNAHNPNACGRISAAFLKREVVGHISVQAGIYDLVEVMVIGALAQDGWHVVSPQVQYTAVFHKAVRS